MKARLANRIERLSESATLKMTKLARQLVSEGKDIINLSIGEPDFNTPEHIKDAAIKAIHANITHYPPVPGFPELREAIVKKYKDEFDLLFDPALVLVSSGAKQSLSNVILCLLEEGDEILIPAPYWVSYPEMAKLSNGKIKIIEAKLENDFKITPEQLEKALSMETRMFLFSTPSNPSGAVYTLEELEEMAVVFRKFPELIIVSDEIYDYINFNNSLCTFAQIKDLHDRLIIVNGVSKGFAMTGWRIGYMIAPDWVIKACNKLQGQLTSGASSISQMAALEAYNSERTETLAMRDQFLIRRDLVIELLKDIPEIRHNVPQGAFYFLLDVSHYFGKTYKGNVLENSEDIAMFLLEEAGLSTVSGEAFGADTCIRISFATSEELLKRAFEKMKRAFDAL
jgi:aspartate aminotransferase